MSVKVTSEDLKKRLDEYGNSAFVVTVDAGFTSGSKATDPQHMASVPFMREAGKEGLKD